MSILDKLAEERDKFFREHNITNSEGRDVCLNCLLSVWDSEFPTYCQGPTTNLKLGSIDTNNEVYSLNAEILHLHNKALIKLCVSGVLDDEIMLDIDKEDLKDLISKLSIIYNKFKS